ncbi:hypothetical protein B4079_5386 [Bacillus cereus]|uniref:Uncharacterized protein n=2 Tax=Bacillus cereus group TaxID=86661 RepID=Q737E4_BACC1|nr:hypothetical protein BCE_2705 [Bacillus cereus ATCC 10987]KYP99462.1 hypothetical protein B4079_5386 [Bacillus cereus]SME42664.1 hypothetical protein BACERE00191_05268 [Bacillus pacificus]
MKYEKDVKKNPISILDSFFASFTNRTRKNTTLGIIFHKFSQKVTKM